MRVAEFSHFIFIIIINILLVNVMIYITIYFDAY